MLIKNNKQKKDITLTMGIDLIIQMQKLADELFEGNLSLLTRVSVKEWIKNNSSSKELDTGGL